MLLITELLQHQWEAIPQVRIRHLCLSSMQRRLQACIRAQYIDSLSDESGVDLLSLIFL